MTLELISIQSTGGGGGGGGGVMEAFNFESSRP